MKRTFSFQLSTGSGDDRGTVIALARAALARGHDVRVFLMDDGVFALREPALESLFRAGAEIGVCALSASARGVARVDWAVWGTQGESAANVLESDRCLAFD